MKCSNHILKLSTGGAIFLSISLLSGCVSSKDNDEKEQMQMQIRREELMLERERINLAKKEDVRKDALTKAAIDKENTENTAKEIGILATIAVTIFTILNGINDSNQN